MIAGLIEWCINNRVLVLLLGSVLVALGLLAVFNINIDAIPDLSDAQVIIRTEYSGQSPQIVEDQITYPLTTAMLSVPFTKAVRGYSMFGTSFVYIIFEDGTDIYWARSRVLEQLSVVTAKLPEGVSPQLGPDATGVGWIYQYMLVTGKYCPEHPEGLWYDPEANTWYEKPEDIPEDKEIRDRIVHHRIFTGGWFQYLDPETNMYYDEPGDAPEDVRDRLRHVELVEGFERCPLDNSPLVAPDIDLASLRSLQDWYLRYELTTVAGVSEVAPVGGFVRQYQVTVDPVRLRAFNIPIQEVKRSIQRSNLDVGGRLLEMSETEYMVRGIGYLGSLSDAQIAQALARGVDIEKMRMDATVEQLKLISLSATEQGAPIYLNDVANVAIGPEIRRGIAEWNGEGESVGGIVVMRFGENARTTIEGVREKLEGLEKNLPPGVAIFTAYDRSDLIDRAVETLSHTLLEEMTVVALVTILFLIHARSAFVAVVVLPTGVLGSLIIMYLLGINANIMSLGGIAIAIGVMIDSAVIMVENAHNHFDREKKRVANGGKPRSHAAIIAEAAREVGPSLFFSLLIITVSFLPVFALGEQSGRLFKPLAFTKTFAMAVAAVLAVTLIPALMFYFVRERMLPGNWSRIRRIGVYIAAILVPAVLLAFMPLETLVDYRWWLVPGWIVLSGILILPQKILSENRNPLSWILQKIYDPFFILAMRYRWFVIVGSVLIVVVSFWPLSQLGSEFMPPLEEGDFLYMPNTDPGLSITKAKELLQQTDRLIKRFPEVVSVMGKIGRAETATDPAPLTMIETTIILERDKSKWRRVPTDGFDSIFSATRPITLEELTDGYELPGGQRVAGINDVLRIPGLTGALTRGSMPIKTRIDMLSTGIKTRIGIKVMGPELSTLADISDRIVQVLKTDPEIKAYLASAVADRTVGGNYVDIRVRRDEVARYGLTVADVQEVIMTALGGMNITFTIEGRERYPVNIRYPRELRDDIPALRQILVATKTGAQIPLAQLADFEVKKGPPMIRSENARPTSWIYVDIKDIDLGAYVSKARNIIEGEVSLPSGYSLVWSGQFEYMESANRSLMVIIPIAGVVILLLLYLATRSWIRTILVVVTLSFAMVGAVWLLYLLDFNMSLAVWVGIISLLGLSAETGLIMLLFLDSSFERFKSEGRMRDENDLWFAVHDGAVKRIRPKTMTVMTTFIALLPLMFASGAGADTMRRLAAPMIGGLATSFILELLIYPVIYYMIKKPALAKEKL